MEAKVFVYSLRSNSSSFIKIDNLPLLIFASVVTPDAYSLHFLVFVSFNFKNLAALPVCELAVLILEDLEPSRVGTPDLHVVGFT